MASAITSKLVDVARCEALDLMCETDAALAIAGADDLNAALADPQVRAVLVSIGGMTPSGCCPGWTPTPSRRIPRP